MEYEKYMRAFAEIYVPAVEKFAKFTIDNWLRFVHVLSWIKFYLVEGWEWLGYFKTEAYFMFLDFTDFIKASFKKGYKIGFTRGMGLMLSSIQNFLERRIFMRNKILTIFITVILAKIIFLLYKGDALSDFIPIIESVSSRHLRAQDFFLVIAVLIFRIIFAYSGINLSSIRNIPCFLKPARPLDLGVLVAVGFATYYFVYPYLYEIFRQPLSVMANTHSSLRRMIIMSIPLIWLWIVALLTKNMCTSYTAPPAQPANTQTLPVPPQW